VHRHTHTYTCTRARIYTNTNIHAHTHTHTYSPCVRRMCIVAPGSCIDTTAHFTPLVLKKHHSSAILARSCIAREARGVGSAVGGEFYLNTTVNWRQRRRRKKNRAPVSKTRRKAQLKFSFLLVRRYIHSSRYTMMNVVGLSNCTHTHTQL
jgi:hypothetical protein